MLKSVSSAAIPRLGASFEPLSATCIPTSFAYLFKFTRVISLLETKNLHLGERVFWSQNGKWIKNSRRHVKTSSAASFS